MTYNQMKRELKQEKKRALFLKGMRKEIYLLGFEYFGCYSFNTNIGILES